MEHVIELIEINIHDWTRKLGHLAAHLMPTSVTIRRCPAGREGSLLRSGMGRMPVTVLKREESQRGHCNITAAMYAYVSPASQGHHIYIYGSEGALGLQPGSRLD